MEVEPLIFTDTGLELPVLDITHPLFETSIDENSLADQRAESSLTAAMIRAMPEAQRKMITDHSCIWGTHFSHKAETNSLSGMGTYMLKLGPRLLGGGEERKIDLRATMGVGGIAARMRLRDLCRLQTEVLSPLLTAHPGERLCLINIAGGAASDTFNTLRLIQRRDSNLLLNRRIEIHLLEIDTICRSGSKSADLLRRPSGSYRPSPCRGYARSPGPLMDEKVCPKCAQKYRKLSKSIENRRA